MIRPFADSVAAYAQAGWPCVLPVPPEKSPPPVGFTGADGRDTDPMQLTIWAGTHAAYSVALRMPDGVIGIDVDAYEKAGVVKHGDDSFAAAIATWGPLPATWTSTARGVGPSRIHFYRVPPGRYATKLAGGDVEIIQRHHRYAVVWPSPHKDAGDIYRWYDPTGNVVEQPPKPNELPELPQPWVDGLAEGATEAGPQAADRTSGETLLNQLLTDERPACAEIASAALDAVKQLSNSDAGSRHDTAIARVHQLVQLAAAGHPGLGRALPSLAALWADLTAGEDRGDEWDRMLLTSARKAVSVVGLRQVGNDPCMVIGSIPIAAPAPADDRPGADPAEPIEPPRQLHPLEVIGAHLFDPRGHLDQTMAQAVLERTYPALRYAYDAKTWMLRGPETWDTRSDLAEWAVALLAELMPHGDPAAEKGTDLRDQAERRKRFMSAGPSSAVAKKTRALVAGGVHPCSLRISELDREPWLLWAGGVGWDLRASYQHPVPAQIDPATPHLHSAGIAPDVRPTPLWDAFTAAVWPDPDLRAWALRVLSITLTGYSDKALPILIGERDRGKTQVVALLMSVLGTYAHAADPRLLSGADKAHASIIYALMGRRLSFIDEGPPTANTGQERLKQLTGGGELTGNQMNTNPVTFAPTHTLVLTANDEPLLTDPAVRGRARLIPCEGDPDQVIAARAAIGSPAERAWRNEAPGVLAAMMREAAGWLADRSTALTGAAPERYRYRGEAIAAEQDPIAAWLEDETEPHEAGERSRALYEAFVGWCKNGNHHPSRIPSETKWGRELSRRDFPPAHTESGKRRPLRLRPRSWLGHAQPVSAAAQPVSPKPVPAPEILTGSPNPDGFLTGSPGNPSGSVTAVNAGLQDPEIVVPDGLTGCTPSIAHAPAHDARVGPEGKPPPNPSFLSAAPEPAPQAQASPPAAAEAATLPFSAQITAKLLAAQNQPEPTSPPAIDQPAPSSPPAIDQPAPSSAQALSLEYHELRRQQDARVEAATRGHLTDRHGKPSEEVLRYFGEGEFDGDRVEERLTYARFLAQRRPGVDYEKAQQAAYDAGARLGRKHATQPSRPEQDADYERAGKKHDPDAFSAGYVDGITEHDRRITDAAGDLVQLPAVVTRDGTVRSVQLEDVREILAAFGWPARLTVDVETTGFPIGHADYALRTVQLGSEHAAVVFDATDPVQLAAAGFALNSAEILHAHSATADLVPLSAAGAIDGEQAWARMIDTVIPAKLADPNSTGSDPGLKQLAGAVLGDTATAPAADDARAALFKAGKWLTDTKATTPVERSGWAQVDPTCTTMVRYAASDVLDTAALARLLPPVAPAVLERERTAQRATARVTERGLRIDGDHVARLLEEHTTARAAAAERVHTQGIDNPGSNPQVGTKLLELGALLPATATGKPSVAEGVLDPMRDVPGPIGQLVTDVLEYRHHDTALGTFLEPYHQLVTRGDGRARPTVYTLAADTGRMSCVRPNLQQVPREGGFRACITADPGTLLVSADFAGVELRVAAALSGDRNLQRMLADGIDVHWEIARLAFGPDATKSDRYAVKRGVFGRIYGGGVAAIARGVGVSETVAAAIIDALDAMLPELAAWSRTVRDAVKGGQTQFPTYAGRVIHLPAAYPHKAPNYCIQGTARELLVDTLVRLRDTRWADTTLLPVHDELLLVVPEADAQQATADLVAAMQTELYGVAIKAEASTPSFFWADAS